MNSDQLIAGYSFLFPKLQKYDAAAILQLEKAQPF